MVDDTNFKWLPVYEPGRAVHRVQTCIEVSAAARAVWEAVVDATQWPKWLALSKDVLIADGKRLLEAGSSFKWTMQGLRFVSTIYKFEPFVRLSWRSSNPLISTSHIWALEELDGSTKVVTDETQRGLLPTLLGSIVKKKLKKGQQDCLDSLNTRIGELSAAA